MKKFILALSIVILFAGCSLIKEKADIPYSGTAFDGAKAIGEIGK